MPVIEVPFCTNRSSHERFEWLRDPSGFPLCPFDSPLRLDDSDLYWTFPEEGGRVSFDDEARTAMVYVEEEGGDGEPRPYTQAENDRADQMESEQAVAEAQAELARAVQLNAAPEELQALQEATLAGEGIAEGDPWRQPTGAHDAYPLGAIVSHNGGTWESTIAANVWEPGISGWKDAGPGVPEWVQPTGAHDAYNQGDIVTHNGLFWRSNINANVWEPPEQWTEIEEP